MQEETVVFWLFTFVIAGGVFVIVNALKYRAKILEMAHRERLAMIERGLKPTGPLLDLSSARPARARSSRMMSGGIVIVGFGDGSCLVQQFLPSEIALLIDQLTLCGLYGGFKLIHLGYEERFIQLCQQLAFFDLGVEIGVEGLDDTGHL